MPKAASTFIQHNFAKNAVDVYFSTLTTQYISQYILAQFIDSIRYANHFNIIHDSKRIDELYDYINNLKEKNVVIAWEGLVGDPYNNFMNASGIKRILLSFFPSAKILLILREQKSLINSLHKQAIRDMHLVGSMSDFLSGNSHSPYDISRPSWWYRVTINYKSLNYINLIKEYSEFNDLLVLPYEMLLEDKLNFFNKITKFTNIKFDTISNKPKNVAYNSVALFFYKRLAFIVRKDYFYGKKTLKYRLFVIFINSVNKLTTISGRINKGRRHENLKFFKGTNDVSSIINKELDKYVEFDLKKYGYL